MTEWPTASNARSVEVQPTAITPPASGQAPGLAEALAGRLRGRGGLKLLLRLGTLSLLAALLYIAFHKAPVHEILVVLGRLQLWQLAALLGLDALIYFLISARWWLVVIAEGRDVPLFPMIAARLSAFAISYFTVGPQLGGEPMQVLFLRKHHGLSYTRAAASVLMDKLFELLANAVLLSFGAVAILHTGIWTTTAHFTPWLIGLVCALMTWPLVHIILLYHSHYPLSTALKGFLHLDPKGKSLRFVHAAEHLAGRFCRRHQRHMLGGILVSLLAASATVSEYALIASFLHVGLPFWQLVTAWTGGWLSFLVPVPGGLGALEVSQVMVLGAYGVPAAAALSVALVLRGRDLVIGGLGLLFAAHIARQSTNPN